MSAPIATVSFVLLCFFLLPFVLPLIGKRNGRPVNDKWFAPMKVVATIHIISIVPYVTLVAFKPDAMSELVRFHPAISDIELAVVKYGSLQVLAFLSLLWGLSSHRADKLAAGLPSIGLTYTPRRASLAIFVGMAVGLLTFFDILARIGGFGYLMDNLEKRTFLTAGMSYEMSFMALLLLSVLVVVYSFGQKRSLGKVVFATVLFLVGTFAYSAFGGRKNTIDLVILLLLVWHYGVRPIKRLGLKVALIGLLVIPYFVAIPIIRAPGAAQHFRNHPEELVSAVSENLSTVVSQTSYVDSYILVVNYFHPGNLWLGRSYADLVLAPIPSSVFPDKPPVDDGAYLWTIANGRDVVPPMPYKALYQSSWPPETFGIAYMNFWIPGLVVGMYILGYLYRAAYCYMVRSSFSLYSIVLYGYMLTGFHLTNLRIVQTGTRVVVATLFFAVFFGLSRRKSQGTGPIIVAWTSRS